MNRCLKVVRVEKIVGKQEMFTSTYTYNTHVCIEFTFTD